MALNALTTMITKFFWKNKILIPCVLFAASFFMLTKIFRQGGPEGSKQPVEYLETIDLHEERKMGRNQLSWNEMEKLDQSVLYKDIYKDFKQKSKGEDTEGHGYVKVKGEGRVEVVEGYERDSWVSRTYDPLSLLKDQGQLEVIDLETIDDYVIRSPDVAMETRKRGQDLAQIDAQKVDNLVKVPAKPAWKGSFVIKTENVDSKKNTNDIYDAGIKKKIRSKVKEMSQQEYESLHYGQLDGDIENNEVSQFQYPPVHKFVQKKRWGSKKRRAPLDNVVLHFENSNGVIMNPGANSVNSNWEENDHSKVKRMGKRKRRKMIFEDQVKSQNYVTEKEPQGQGHETALTFDGNRHLAPKKVYLPLDSEIAQQKNGNIFVGNKNDGPLNSYIADNERIVKLSQNIQNNIPLNNEQQPSDSVAKQYFKTQNTQQKQRQVPQQRRHSNIDLQQQSNQQFFLLQRQQQQQHKQHHLKMQDTKVAHVNQQYSINAPNMHPPLQNQISNQDGEIRKDYVRVQGSIDLQKHIQNSQLNKQSGNHVSRYDKRTFQMKQSEKNEHRKNHSPSAKQSKGLKFSSSLKQQPEQQQQHQQQRKQFLPKHENQRQVDWMSQKQVNPVNQFQQNGKHHGEGGEMSGLKTVGSAATRGVKPPKAVPLPSLGSLISQQNFMLDVQREISEQYAHIQQLQSKLAIANFVAKEMVHKPHVVPQKTNRTKGNGKFMGNSMNGMNDGKGVKTNIKGLKWQHSENEQINEQKDKRNELGAKDERTQLSNSYRNRDNGLEHGVKKGKIYDRFGKPVNPDRHGDIKYNRADFKLKHKRKPKSLQHSNQTRAYAFEKDMNGTLIAVGGGNLSNPYDVFNYTMFPLNFTLDLAGIRQKLQKLSDQTLNTGVFTRRLRHTLYKPLEVTCDLFTQWRSSRETMCGSDDDVFEGYDDKFARLRNVVVAKQLSYGKQGGENISDVINQDEGAEYYRVYKGFWQVRCDTKLQSDNFLGNHHINQWFYALDVTKDASADDVTIVKEFTIAVVRYEYANLYHTMTDFYNAFLVMEFFNKTQSETNILLIDGHPKSILDDTWRTLFNSTKRISHLPDKTLFSDLAWGIVGYESPMNDHYMSQLPLVEEFRTFFLSTYDVPHDDVTNNDVKVEGNGGGNGHVLNCDSLSVLFIWRRDYVAHPRNPSGAIQRKVENEQQLITTLRKKFGNYTVRGVQIDLFDMRQQLQFITSSDILIGMHGAGLTHAIFLPKHAGIIELIPNYWSAANMHFEAIATWRNLFFDRWTNDDPQNEAPNYSTTIPPEVIATLIKNMVRRMCNTSTDQPAYHGPASNNMNQDGAKGGVQDGGKDGGQDGGQTEKSSNIDE